jgi:HD superfamily phosphodiesterase
MAYGRKYMKITEHAIPLLEEMERSVQDHYGDFADLAHGSEHIHRVYHLAIHLAEQEQADGFIVGMAALLHDLGRTTRGPTHSLNTTQCDESDKGRRKVLWNEWSNNLEIIV